MKVVEVSVGDHAGHWKVIGEISEPEPCGSMSSHEPEGRQVYMFGWRDDKPGVWRSVRGFDVENPAFREVNAIDLEQLSDLAEPFELDVHHERLGVLRLRLRVV